MSLRIAIAVLALAACDSTGGGAAGGPKVAESGTAKGSGGGFSAQMSAELAKAGVGEPVIPQVASAGSVAAGGGGSASAAGSGSAEATPAAGSASAGSAEPAAGSATAPATGSASAPTAPAASGTPAAAGSGAAAPSAPSLTATGAVKATASRTHVKPAPDVAAIKFDLEPNWERDMGEAGTFSLVVKIPNTDDTRVFSVRYGYEDQTAPVDCDGYKKYLEDRGAMKVTLHRQRGATCYLEGTDQGGALAYRMMLTYGGKRLLCHGSLYKDAASSALGDLRDKVLTQGKKICETLAL